MTIKLFLTIFGVIAVLFGIAFVLAPETLGAIYGTQNTPTSVVMARFFGDALLAWGLILWFARDFSGDALRGVLRASGIANVVGVLVAANAVMSGVVNTLGWTSVLIYLLGGVGSFYFLTVGSPQKA